MKVSASSLVPYFGGFNVRHQKPELTIGHGDNMALTGGIEDGEMPSTSLIVHRRSMVFETWV